MMELKNGQFEDYILNTLHLSCSLHTLPQDIYVAIIKMPQQCKFKTLVP